MDKQETIKNILDLKFKLQCQTINTSLILSTIGLLTFISTFIWYKERLFFGIALSMIILVIALIMYSTSKNKIEIIFKRIQELDNN